MESVPLPRFYVYILCRPNGKPFYVGKGKGKRVFVHEGEARSACHCRKCHVIRKIWRNGGQVQRYIVFETDNEQEAFEYEREQIAMYGRENLTNLTDGGDGPAGRQTSDERRQRQSIISREIYSRPGMRQKTSEAGKRFRATPEGKAFTARLSERMREIWSDPARRARHAETARIALSKPEIRKQRSKENARRMQDPDYKARLLQKLHDGTREHSRFPAIAGEIRRLYADGSTVRQLREQFACSDSHIRRIIKGAWPDTPEEGSET